MVNAILHITIGCLIFSVVGAVVVGLIQRIAFTAVTKLKGRAKNGTANVGSMD
jgi:hypothetical protein